MTVNVVIQYADGGLSEHEAPLGILAKHDRLLQQGLTGRALVDGLLGDDWAAPPRVVTLKFDGEQGPQTVELFYSY